MTDYTKGDRTKLCSCGNPQSYPIPHEHDRTEREKQIIEYKDGIISDLYEALKRLVEWLDDDVKMVANVMEVQVNARKALAKAKP